MSFGDLPYISTIYEKHICNADCDCLKTYKHNVVEKTDRRLDNWDEWMKERKQVHKHIGKNVNRSPDKLVQNMFENRRNLEERKLVLEYSKIAAPPDKYRGSPAFWKLPTSLVKQCDEDQTYYTVMSKAEKCEIPSIEYVHVPGHIKKEKEAVCTRNTNDMTKLKYYQEKYMSEQIKFIEPHKPDLDNLVLVGKSIHKEDEIEKTPIEDKKNATFTVDSDSPKIKERQCFLIVNEKCIYNDVSGEISVVIIFHEAKQSTLCTQLLHIENKSKFCLRFHFTPQEEKKKLQHLPELKNFSKQVLYFNKNIHLIQPGEKIDFPFWFKAYNLGSYRQALSINIIPDIVKFKIVLKLVANISGNSLYRQYLIGQRLENQIRDRVIAEALEDVTKYIPKTTPDIQIYSYDRAAIFEAVNSTYDPINFRPKYYYDKSIVDELEIFYENVKLEKHEKTWDYKLDTLRIVTKDRELYDKEMQLQEDLQHILVKIKEAKLERSKLEEKAQSFWSTGDKKNKGKKDKSVKKGKTSGKDKSSKGSKESKKSDKKKGGKDIQKIEEPVRKALPKTLSNLLEDIIAKLKTPSSYPIEHFKRLRQCYSLLCAYIDKICEDVQKLEISFDIERLQPKIRKFAHIEKMYEPKFDSIVVERPVFVEITKTKFQKAPEWTSEIPIENYTERYHAYHGKSTAPVGKGKNKEKDQKKNSKSGKEKKSKSSDKKKSIKKDTEAQVDLKKEETVEIEDSICDESVSICSDISEHYENNTYLIFYTYLTKFVDDLVAVSELEENPSIPPNVIQRIQYSQFDKMRINSDLQIRVFDLKRVISNVLSLEDKVPIKSDLKLVPKYEPPEVEVASSSSVWDILKAYYPKQKVTQDYTKDEMYAVPLNPFPPETTDGGNVAYEEDIILDRSVQTSLCGSKTVCFANKTLIQPACKCKSEEFEEDKTFSFHASKISTATTTSDGTFKEDSNSCRNN